jgi:radical SAM superfamily enzyme YgiQ (UPF0313 family)
LKIALISMNGIRANDKELLRLGLNLPGFVERSRAIASLPSLGLLTLGALTPPEHEQTYIEVPDINEMASLPQGYDLAAISCFSAQIEEAYQLADRLRAAGTTVVMGGNHVSSETAEALGHADCVMIGEGELFWQSMLADAQAGCLKETYGSMFGNFDLSDSPLPAYRLLDPAKYNRVTLQTSRGCPMRCEFCASSVLYTRRYKQKPKDLVIAEMKQLKALFPRPFIEFVDDNAFVDKRYWKALLPEIAEQDVRWFAETDVSVADDPELLESMKLAGCKQVLIGFESPVEEGLNGLELNSNWKAKRWKKYKQAIHRIQSHGIRVIACFMVGLDGQGEEIFPAILQFVREATPFDVQITVPTAFPGTPYYRRLLADDRLIEPRAWSKCTLFDVNFRPTNMTADELSAGFRKLGVELYGDEMMKHRRDGFMRQWKDNIICRRRAHREAI